MRSPERLRAVVVGAGLMGRWHADAALRAGARIAAIVDADRQRASALAARFRECAADASLTAAVRAADAQVVHLCTPTETHEALAQEALEAGCHVLVEKPLAPTLAATRRLLDLAAARRVLLCPCHQFLYQHGVLRACNRLPALGRVRHVDVTICSAGAEGQSDTGRHRTALDILPHPFSLLARVLTSRLDTVAWQVLLAGPGELHVAAAADGVTASVLVSMSGRPPVNVLRIIAERGTIQSDLFHGFAIEESATVSRTWKIVRPFATAGTSLVAAAANLSRRALHAEHAYPGLRELVQRFYRAAAEGGPCPISEVETLAVAGACDVVASIAERR